MPVCICSLFLLYGWKGLIRKKTVHIYSMQRIWQAHTNAKSDFQYSLKSSGPFCPFQYASFPLDSRCDWSALICITKTLLYSWVGTQFMVAQAGVWVTSDNHTKVSRKTQSSVLQISWVQIKKTKKNQSEFPQYKFENWRK